MKSRILPLLALVLLLFSTFGIATAQEQDDEQAAWGALVEMFQNSAPAADKIMAIKAFLEKYGQSERVPKVAYMAARVYVDELGQAEKAVELLAGLRAKAKNKQAKDEYTSDLIWAYGNAGDKDGLRALADEITKSGELDPVTCESIGSAALEMGDFMFAVEQLEKAQDGATWEWFKTKRSDWTDERITERRDWFIGMISSALGEAYMHLKRYADAEEAFARAAQLSEKNFIGVYNNDNQIPWARALAEQGKTDAAIDKLLVPAILRNNPEAEELLEVLYRKKHGESGAYEKFIEIQGMALAKPAPDFTLEDYKGNFVSLSSFKGKVIMLDFWFPT